MADPRFARLAEVLIGHSTRLQKGEHILIEAFDLPEQMVLALVRAARQVGARPHVAVRSNRIMRALVDGADEANLETWAACDRHRMEQMDAYLGLRGNHNVSEMAGLDTDDIKRWGKLYQKPVHLDERVNNTRWCVLRWPTPSMAQLAQMSTDAFEDFYFNVCTMDYGRMETASKKLAARMNRTDQVQFIGPGETDLRFSIKDIPAVPCYGSHNIPDGECFTAPVRESVNGVIAFNTPTIYQGTSFENVRLEFRDGRIVDASATLNGDRINDVFNTDEGARYVGEFAIGFNPYILEPMKDILFDEKIAGSLHFTPGQCYEDASNGNDSEIHWDLVLIQREDYGGGQILFDGEVVRQNGIFIADDLTDLNPDALTG